VSLALSFICRARSSGAAVLARAERRVSRAFFRVIDEHCWARLQHGAEIEAGEAIEAFFERRAPALFASPGPAAADRRHRDRPASNMRQRSGDASIDRISSGFSRPDRKHVTAPDALRGTSRFCPKTSNVRGAIYEFGPRRVAPETTFRLRPRLSADESRSMGERFGSCSSS
jgi:hypothetical protein